MDSNTDPVLAALLDLTEPLKVYVRTCFPRLCTSHVEDAVASVWVALVEQRELFTQAHEDDRLLGLGRVVAWRHARGIVRRRGYSHEVSGQDLLIERFSNAPRQFDRIVVANIEALIPRVARETSARHAEPLAAALRHRLFTGEAEGTIARRFGIRREYLNRARRQLCAAVSA